MYGPFMAKANSATNNKLLGGNSMHWPAYPFTNKPKTTPINIAIICLKFRLFILNIVK